MAELLWGQVFYKDQYVGILRQEPGDRSSFQYDEHYLASGDPAISVTLPLQAEAFNFLTPLPPFFDNLVAEGWLAQAQTRLLGKRDISRFALLLAFGFDCAGAVSVMDPSPMPISDQLLDLSDPQEMAVLHQRASLSGVQPKMAMIRSGDSFVAAGIGQLSTHIAKFASPSHAGLIENEYLTMKAFSALLPDHQVAPVSMESLTGFEGKTLIVERFDRNNGDRIHFEEFNQLLSLPSKAKYDGSYQDMACWMNSFEGILPFETYRLFQAILAGLLLGNTDMHFKNFAMWHTDEGLRLTPSYDQVSAVQYGYKSIALALASKANMQWGSLKANHLVRLGRDCQLSDESIKLAVDTLSKQLDHAKSVIDSAEGVSSSLKTSTIDLMEKRWNGTFALIGKHLSTKQ